MTPTPLEFRGGHWVKRDDLYAYAGQRGGKVRTCRHLAGDGRPGLVTAGSRHSPQVEIVAGIAAHLGVPCRVHVPAGDDTPQTLAAADYGATIIRHRPGYNTVITARARADAEATGWRHIPFGMETPAAVEMTAGQVPSVLAVHPRRIVVPVGSGMTLAGILHGLAKRGSDVPVLGVVVGADPTRRLDRHAPIMWRHATHLVPAELPYHAHAHADLDGLILDPVYEAKCVPLLQPGDLLWLVGIRRQGGTQP